MPQENVGALKWVSDHVSVPIATGVRLLTRWQFREVCEQHAVAYLQPDVSHVGGISELRKVANLGEIYVHAHHAALRDRPGGAGLYLIGEIWVSRSLRESG